MQKQRAYHFLSTGEIIGPKQLRVNEVNEKRVQRMQERDALLNTVEGFTIPELKARLEERQCRATGQRRMLEKRLRDSLKKEWDKKEQKLREAEDKFLEEKGHLVSSERGVTKGGSIPVHFEV